ncbi:hypothetical protein ACJRO7_034983 [Eucalyptus globulus]|uniref:Uncharacterized protein n=1 Tax=Eucalyptus globulus TaxID=34317 RepID=A0ABD3J8B9_EUCGL
MAAFEGETEEIHRGEARRGDCEAIARRAVGVGGGGGGGGGGGARARTKESLGKIRRGVASAFPLSSGGGCAGEKKRDGEKSDGAGVTMRRAVMYGAIFPRPLTF